MLRKIALVFDVDNTLISGYHPSVVLERRGIDSNNFWKKVIEIQRKEKEKGEKTNLDIIYLAHFMHNIRYGKLKGLTLAEIKDSGKYIDKMFYPGIPEFFEKIKNLNKNVSFNLVSVGIKPLLEGSSLVKYMDYIFGYTFFDDMTEGPQIDEIKSTSSSSEKIPAIVAISYGKSETGFEYPIKDMIYFGDGETDRAAFRFVKKRGGTSICIFDPEKELSFENACNFKGDVNYILPADYREGSEICEKVKEIIL